MAIDCQQQPIDSNALASKRGPRDQDSYLGGHGGSGNCTTANHGEIDGKKGTIGADLPTTSHRHSHLSAEVTTTHADILLLTCCLISGLVDSTIYNAYGTFVSMQTGNTIFLGLGGSTGHTTSKPYGWAKSLVSIVCFCMGCFVFSRMSRLLGSLKRGTLSASFLLQAIIVLVCAGIVQGGVVDGSLEHISHDIDWRQLIPIALLSFQSAGQIVGSRVLNLSEIPTVVLTSMLHDISTDPQLTAPLHKNVKRNRRVGAYAGILIGAVAGGFISKATGRMQIALWIAGALKLMIVVAWLLWPAKKAHIAES